MLDESPAREPREATARDERCMGRAEEPRNWVQYRQMRFIRRFEETLLELFEEGVLNGTTHCAIGQEADAVGIMPHLTDEDHIFSNHRCHAHYLARTGDALGLLAEIMGKPSGVCGGIGGSQHLCRPGFKSNGVQGGIVPAAAGIAWAAQLEKSERISVVFIGDGTLGEGVVYETANVASLWSLPLWIVVEDNGWSQSTPVAQNLAGSIRGRFEAFGLPVREVDTTDVEVIDQVAQEEINNLRVERRPRVFIIHTYRLCHHSKNDDRRPKAEVAARWAIEPLVVHGARLTASVRERIEVEVETALAEVVARARAL